jgi:chromosomal replication initiation ATPase DnaA
MATDAATYQDASISASVIKGSDLFVKHVMRSATRSAAADRVVRRCSVEQVASLTAASAGLTVDQLRAPGQQRLLARERGLAAYVGWKHARIPLARTARLFNREESTLVRAVRRIEAALDHDRSLSRRLAFLVSSLEQLEASEAIGKDQEFRVDPKPQSSGVHG